MQTKLQSLHESFTNIAIGYVTAILSQLLIFPLFAIHITLSDNLLIGIYFTIISLLRSYIVRRYFNHKGTQCKSTNYNNFWITLTSLKLKAVNTINSLLSRLTWI